MFPFLVDINMAEQNKLKLYTYNGEQYSFQDLSKDLDAGFADYISTLRRGDKDSEEFWNAYSNLMSGIGDGTIVFENGRFNDSLGRYSNGVWYDSEGNKQTSGKKSRDYYGLVANYIAKGLRRQKKYQAEKPKPDASKIRWGDAAGTAALAKLYFNSSAPNLSYFLDLDPFQDGQRGVTNRVAAIRSFIKDHFLDSAYDNTFSGYTDSDKVRFTKYAQQAYDALADNSIDAGDKLVLSRIFPNVDFDKMFYTGEKLEQQQRQQQQGQEQQKHEPTPEGFAEFLSQDSWVRKPNDSNSFILNPTDNLGQWTLSRYRDFLSGLNDSDLGTYFLTSINNPDMDFSTTSGFQEALGGQRIPVSAQWVTKTIINVLNNRGKLIQDKNNPSIYYIPDIVDKNTNSGFYYDSSTKTLYKRSKQDIQYWRDRAWSEYSGQPEAWYQQYFTNPQYKKNGGIIKAQDGSQLWYQGLSDYDPTKYIYSYDTSRLVNADMSDTNWNPWVSNVAGLGVGRYKPTSGNTREYTQGIENTQYYKNFGNALLNPDGTFTEVGEAWAKAVDANLPKGSLASFYDGDGKLRTSWIVKNQDIYGRSPHTFNNLAEYVNYVRNDQILGSRHNVFLNQGNRYFYRDQEGKEHWVDPNEVSKYTISTDPVRSQWNDDNTIYWNDYELTGLKNPQQDNPEDKGTGSRVNPVSEPQKDEFVGTRFGDFMLGITPDLIGAGRLFASLRTNNRVANTLRESLNPVLRNTYERYSPITGAFSEMQFRNRQAADLRRQASRPFTSDASLQLAGQLDADRQARDLEYQGFLADDREIRRTREAALARQEDNMARRSDVANFNRASINQTNRERAQLEATRLKENWRSVDNFMQGVESRLRTNIAERKALRQSSSSQIAQTKYQEAVQRYNQDYKTRNPNATNQSMLNDPKYIEGINDLRRRYQYEMYNIGLGRYYRDPYRGNVPKTYDEILSSKKGGTLRPNVMYLINKVIRNENNS